MQLLLQKCLFKELKPLFLVYLIILKSLFLKIKIIKLYLILRNKISCNTIH